MYCASQRDGQPSLTLGKSRLPVRTATGRQRRLHRLSPFPVSQARRAKVHKVPSFLSTLEVEKIRSCVKKLQLPAYTNNPEEDISADGAPVHTTMYVNTDGIFSQQLRWLKRKVLQQVHKVNDRERWGFDTHSSRFNLRVAEYHEMEVSGSLMDPTHHDKGSLITVDIMLQGVACV